MKKKRRLRKKIASLYYNIQLCKFRKAVVKVTKSFKADPRPCDIPWGGGVKEVKYPGQMSPSFYY